MARPVVYVRPVPSSKTRRFDQGIDFQGSPGHSVVAIGNATVDAVKDDPGGFGKVVYYTLQDGPLKGQQVYVGHAEPTVAAGDTVGAGAPVATLLAKSLGNASNLSGWTEVGFAKDGRPEPGSSPRFQAFLKTLPDASQPDSQTQAQPQPADTGQAGAAPTPPESPYRPPQLGPSLEPAGALPPGSVQAGGLSPQQIAESWQLIAAQQGASPDTHAWLANAQNAAQGG